MKYYKIIPEVPVSAGEDHNFNPRIASNLRLFHLLFEIDKFSEIFTLFLDFYVTEKIAKALTESELTGIKVIRQVDKIGKSENCLEHYPIFVPPICYIIQITGKDKRMIGFLMINL